jgi:valyl-tRNA synthetase (EC 6.1.1.9)
MNVPPSRKAKLLVVSNSATKAVIKEGENYFTALASASEVSYMDNEDLVPEDAVSVVLDGAKLFIPMDELVDFEKELERLTKEKDKLESEIKRVVGKL